MMDIAALVADSTNADSARRIAAVEQLAQCVAEVGDAVVPLVLATGDEDEVVRETAVAALEECGIPDRHVIAQLVELLQDESADVGYWAVTLLGRLKSDAAAAVPALSGALANSAPLIVQQRAAWALGRMGAAAAPAIDALQAAALRDDPRLTRQAQNAIENIRSAEV